MISGYYSITLYRADNNFFGFRVNRFGPGIFKIVEITPGSPADTNGKMTFGDYLLAVNNRIITANFDINMITSIIRGSGNTLRLRLTSRPAIPGNALNFKGEHFVINIIISNILHEPITSILKYG